MEKNKDDELSEGGKLKKPIIDYSDSLFTVKLPNGGYINVNPEFVPQRPGLSTSGRFHVLYVDSEYGTCTFYVELKDSFEWICYHYPPFIDKEFINWVGRQIEIKGR